MFYVCVLRFDVTRNFEKFLAFWLKAILRHADEPRILKSSQSTESTGARMQGLINGLYGARSTDTTKDRIYRIGSVEGIVTVWS